jgi:hypothetical protein
MTADQLKDLIAAGLLASILRWKAMADIGLPPSSRHSSKASACCSAAPGLCHAGQAHARTDEVHALSMKTYTPAEWAAAGQA